MLEENRDAGIALRDPADEAERAAAARAFAARFDAGMPILVDGLDDAVALTYGAWPDRLYLIGRDGRVAYQGGEGPFGFLPDELEAAIRRELGISDEAMPPRLGGM